MKKTNLQMRVGLNCPPFMEYFEWLTSHGFVERKDEDGTELYSLSPRASMHITVL